MNITSLQPTDSPERIQSLDLLRGFALLGILIMNIISFSDIGTGYINPTVGAGLEGYNGWIHGFSHLFADMRFMSIFSMLFGAGILIFSDNAVEKGKTAWKFHYRRMLLLIVIGFIHSYLIWMGDILVGYAICGSIVFLMRKWKTRTLFIVGGIFFVIPVLLSLMTYFFTPKEQLVEIFKFWVPTQEEVDWEILAYRGSYMDQMSPRMAGAIKLQTFIFFIEYMWRVLSMMLLGMILYRKGIMSAQRDNGFYQKLLFIGLMAGLVISGTGLYRAYILDWNGVWYMNVGHHYNYIASIFVALAYIGLIMLWNKSNILKGLKSRLSAVGRLAFTNYILTSIICTFIFYGHGLGLFATMDRLHQWGIILSVWALLLLISPVILKKYKRGPLEWVWRKLTYL
ncbi:DUF418 domain-containing protein [Candidatus Amoebophilus asiaticus]|nr:DUF418 domain-containing protein [Candidatus Amoebophilus asiaticus]